MPVGKLTAALAVGSIPTAFAFAAIGAGWADQPILALVASYVLPILLLPVALSLSLSLMRLRALPRSPIERVPDRRPAWVSARRGGHVLDADPRCSRDRALAEAIKYKWSQSK
jgi:hypothetical protein